MRGLGFFTGINIVHQFHVSVVNKDHFVLKCETAVDFGRTLKTVFCLICYGEMSHSEYVL